MPERGRTDPPVFRSTPESIDWYARHVPASTAVIDDALRVTYREMADDLRRCVDALAQRGLRPGMLAGVEIRRDRYVHLLLLLACESFGVTTTSFVAVDLKGPDPVLPHCDILLSTQAPAEPGPRNFVVISKDFLRVVRAYAASQRSLYQAHPPEQVLRIVRTSGTSGRPKAMATSRDLMQRIIVQHMQRLSPDVLADPKMLCIYNFGVRACYTRVMGVLRHGGTLLFAKEEQAPAILAAGAVNFVPLMVGDAERIVANAVPPPAGHRHHVDLIGARVGPRLVEKIRERMAGNVSLRYSSNETAIIADMDENNIGTIHPGSAVRIVDENGRDLPAGQTGLILARTDTMVDGYYNDPDMTAAAFVDGWYRTNDFGAMPEPGKLVILGRADDMLNIGGIKVPPQLLEDAVEALPGVADAVVMSVAWPDGADTVLVAVEVAGDLRLPLLRDQIGPILARYVRSFELLVLPSFPRTETGKTRRADIQAAFLRGRDQPPDAG